MMWSGGLRVTFGGKTPRVADDAFVAPNATLIGDVTIGSGASIWFGAVLRADEAPIVVGAGCTVQDNVVIHVGAQGGTTLEADVSVGHAAVVHNCTVRRGAVVGMGACIQDGAVVGVGALVAAGALVPEGFEVPDGQTVGGVPARLMGPNSERSRYFVDVSAPAYRGLVERYRTTGTWWVAGRQGHDG